MTDIRKSLAERTGRWDKLVQNVPTLEVELPHLAPDLRDLTAVLAEVKDLRNRQMKIQAESAEITRKLRERLRAGDRLRGRIGASLRGRFGFDGSRLSLYGFKPRRHRTGASKSPAAETAEAPAGTPPPEE
jgi:hypothetical protein